MVDKIVNNGLKIDLHIHSALSQHKDGKKVIKNNIENLEKLIEGLNINMVNMAAITDHDAFDFELYSKLKEQEGKGSIEKILPGVEFSVEFVHKSIKKDLHIITIFDDTDIEKVRNIEKILSFEDNKPRYDNKESFSQKKFIDILRNIDLNTVMIVHQKNSLLSKESPSNSHDANSLGEEKFEEFLYTEYFEAYEFRNRKNELFSKVYIVEKEYQELLRLITGSDCHSWSIYPKVEGEKDSEFEFTYLKCLPTFKGLVMAMTDYTRIKRNDSFFSVDDKKLKQIKLSIDEEVISIPLSKGINVIIGDNSIGKSLLLHKLTSYSKASNQLQKGYDKYLRNNNMKVESKIDDSMLFLFDKQGEIRDNFENGNLNTTKLLADYYPSKPSVKQYTNRIDGEILKYIHSLETRVEFTTELSKLSTFKILTENESPETISLLNDLSIDQSELNNHKNAQTNLKEIIQEIKDYVENHKKIMLLNEIDEINNFILTLEKYLERIANRISSITFENSKINKIISVYTDKNNQLKRIKGDADKEIENFHSSLKETKEIIVNIKKKEFLITDYSPNISEVQIKPVLNTVYKYQFINKIPISKIDNNYITTLIKGIHKKDKNPLKAKTLTVSEIIESIKNYPETEGTWQDIIKKKISDAYNTDFVYKSSILSDEENDLTRELSSGKNMQIYFDLISFNSFQQGVYLVDQPEDSVSQKSIKEYLLHRFKTMSENRQVIIVTHNPQFIVNLDVDNVIFISKNEDNDKITVKSGALEYECSESGNEYKILEIVANNIDGGIETINRRWKRYEKTIKHQL